MPIPGIAQPELIRVNETIRLRKYDGAHDFALAWYQDLELVWLVDGDHQPYDADLLGRMYRYLDEHGELYWIEALENGIFRPIGDVTFWQQDMPIVIADPAYRGKGVGRAVISALISRGRQLCYDRMYVEEIYHFNTASKKCFESLGFRPYQSTEKGHGYILDLKA